MADDYLYCPSCNNKLRITPEMLGAVVQCPLCNLVFTTPTRGAEVPPVPGHFAPANQDQAREAVRGPARGLMLAGILGAAVHAVQVGVAVLQPETILRMEQKTEALLQLLGLPTGAATAQEKILANLMAGGLFLALNVFLIVSAVQILQLKRYGLAVTGSILAFFDIGNFCCLLAWPVGIWALLVLLRPEVKAAFEQRTG